MSNATVAGHPVSQAKLEANRANAQKSTGPRTPEGKAVSSRNALAHGLLARHIVPVADPVEDPCLFDLLVEELANHFQPRDFFEGLCVNRLAACYWRLDRAQRFESQAIAGARIDSPTGLDPLCPGPDPAIPDFQSFECVMPSAPDFNKLLRYEQMINRELRATLAHLHQHRTDSPLADQPPVLVPPSPNPPIPPSLCPSVPPSPDLLVSLFPCPTLSPSHLPTFAPSHSPATTPQRNEPITPPPPQLPAHDPQPPTPNPQSTAPAPNKATSSPTPPAATPATQPATKDQGQRTTGQSTPKSTTAVSRPPGGRFRMT